MARVFAMHAKDVIGSALNAAQGDRMRAEEAMMDSFEEAAQTIWAGFINWPDDKQKAWLRRRAVNRVIDSWRKTSRISPVEEIPEPEADSGADDIALKRIAVDRCWQVIMTMSLRRKQAAFLHWHEGKTITEVAEWLGVDRATVSRDLAAVVAILKATVGDEMPFIVRLGTAKRNENWSNREEVEK
jgi:RNA polymerase sigma factor (sigma-70 family)